MAFNRHECNTQATCQPNKEYSVEINNKKGTMALLVGVDGNNLACFVWRNWPALKKEEDKEVVTRQNCIQQTQQSTP